MKQSVTIKGTKSGIILVLDGTTSFSEIKEEMAVRFQEAATFLGRNKMGLIIRGRKLSDAEHCILVPSLDN